MKKTGFFILISTLIMFSCAESKKEYTLTGKIPGVKFEGKTVYLHSKYDKNGVIDSTKVTNGVFTFKGAADTIALRYVRLDERVRPVVFFSESGNIEVTVDTAQFTQKLSGTPLNQSYQSYQDGLKSLYETSRKMEEKREEVKKKGEMTAAKHKELETEDQAYLDKIESYICDFVKTNANNAAGQFAFFDDTYFVRSQKLMALLPSFDAKFKESDRFKKMEARIVAADATSEGKTFTDVKGLSIAGKEDALSNYVGKGKVVLVDFWASWCGPCRAAMPEMRAFYEKNKDKVTIVGISLDDSKENWEKATKAEKISWAQFSNLKGWDEPAAVTYGVSGIPHLMLIDKNGVIVKRGISGDALQYAIDDLLK